MADFVPQQSAHLGQHMIAQQQGAGSVASIGMTQPQQPRSVGGVNDEALEMQAFEKGRVQGEMEAMRRLQQDGALHKQMGAGAQPNLLATQQQPDIVEIHRLTNVQRLAFALGQACNIAMLVLGLVWVLNYRDGVTFTDEPGNARVFNVFLLTQFLGLFLLANAITNYRVLPIRTSPWVNRAWYIFLQLGTMTCFWLGLVAWVYSSPEARFWSITHWCWALAATVYTLHALYSIFRTLVEPAVAVTYEEWAEVNNKLTTRAGRNGTIGAAHNERTLYAPQPDFQHTHAPHSNANVGAEVPIAPINAPRWAENPHTHAEDYFLLPRSKWAVVGFWSMGAAFLMALATVQHNMAKNGMTWAQGVQPAEGDFANRMSENGSHARIIGALGLVTLFMLCLMSYVAMPPRTTLVKNGLINERDLNARRSSVSHNAETRNSMV